MKNVNKLSSLQYVIAAGKPDSLLKTPHRNEVKRVLEFDWEMMKEKAGKAYFRDKDQAVKDGAFAERELNVFNTVLKGDNLGKELSQLSEEQVYQSFWNTSLTELWGAGPDLRRMMERVGRLVTVVEKFNASQGTENSGRECNMLGVVVGAVVEYGKAQSEFGFTPEELGAMLNVAVAPLVYRRDELKMSEAGAVIEQLKEYYQ